MTVNCTINITKANILSSFFLPFLPAPFGWYSLSFSCVENFHFAEVCNGICPHLCIINMCCIKAARVQGHILIWIVKYFAGGSYSHSHITWKCAYIKCKSPLMYIFFRFFAGETVVALLYFKWLLFLRLNKLNIPLFLLFYVDFIKGKPITEFRV